jgi:aspartate racemase
MKRIGILGGMGPKSTVDYYGIIVDAYYQKFGDYAFPEIIIYSVNFQHFIGLFEKDQWDKVLDEVINAIGCLYQAGAEFGIMATNTLHVIFEKARKKSPLPLISIVDSVLEAVQNAGIQKVGLLATIFTMNADFYPHGLSEHGIKVLLPNSEDQRQIQRIIGEELTMGLVNRESKKMVLSMIDGLMRKGAQGIILGCTELRLMVNQQDCSGKIFDSTFLHAKSALRHALE